MLRFAASRIRECVSSLVNGMREAAHHDTTLEASSLPCGNYRYVLKAGEHEISRVMTLLK